MSTQLVSVSKGMDLQMGKQKQQVISRFFAPKPQLPSSSSSSSSISPSKISTTVNFSASKRLQSAHFHPHKKPKLSSHTHNPIPPISDPNLQQKYLQKLLEPSQDEGLERSEDEGVEPSKKSGVPTYPHKEPGLSTRTQNLDLHQKFLRKLLEPSSDEGLEPSKKSGVPTYTPLEQQVVELKNKYKDVVLMVEVGYKYRFFGKDAEIAARVLGIFAHLDHNFLTASVPTFRLNVHVRRLVSEGYKVGVVKQTETASIKARGSNRVGPFSRGLSALYTKATIEAAEALGGGQEGCGSLSNYMCCVVEREGLVENDGGFEVRIGVVGVEVSTGDVVYGEFNDDFMRGGLEGLILSLSPAELILGDPLSKRTQKLLSTYVGPTSNVRVEHASSNCFKDGGALAEVMSLFEECSYDKLDPCKEHHTEVSANGAHKPAIEAIMGMPSLAVQALALTLRHLKQFGLERIVLGASFQPFSSQMEMNLSANALQQLEVLRNNSDGSESGSLLATMNHTLTISGQRLLKHWVTHPLCERNAILARLDAVTEIAESMGSHKATNGYLSKEVSDAEVIHLDKSSILSSVLANLGQSIDIQRGITRILHRTATPSEFVSVVQAILSAGKQLQRLSTEGDDHVETRTNTIRSTLLRKLISTASSSSVINSASNLLSTLDKEAAEKRDLLNLILVSDGRYPEVATARAKVRLANEKLESLIGLYRKQFRLRNLEFMSVSGTTHLIELPSEAKVPSNWMKVNSTKKTIRYHPPEVLTALDELSLANEELAVVCRSAWDNFLGEFSRSYAEFRAAVQALAALDCLHSLAILSRNKNYVRPVFVKDGDSVQIQITSGRHPVLDTILQDNFVPNDTNLHADEEYCQIVTGPNMGGKSCYIRQVALITLMAQVGSCVPASSAYLHVLDAIYTRMGASDNIQQGRSTFLEELSEASHVLRHCTNRSLVVIDELGRGTSTHDGVAIAYATLHHLLQEKRCPVLFVTHYPEIAGLEKEVPGAVGVYHVSYLTSKREGNKIDDGDVTYLYKLVPGVSERSFGFKVAELAQLPSSCIGRAISMATKFESAVQNRNEHRGRDGWRDAYSKLFSHLTFAIEDGDMVKSLELLRCARRAAVELLAR